MKNQSVSKYTPRFEWKAMLIFVIMCFALQGLKTIIAKGNLINFSSKICIYIGIGVLIIGLIDSAVEKYMGLGFFYGQSQRAGSNANSFAICAAGIVLLSPSFLITMILTIIAIIILGGERYFIESKRCVKMNRYIGKKGTAKTDINYKGKGMFEGELLKVRVTHDKIEKGDSIQITDIDGFNLIVERVKNETIEM